MAISFIKLNVPYRLLDSTADTYVMVDRVTSENIDVNTFVPKLSEVFFFPEENGYRAIKIGDGVNTLEDLPFAGSADASDLAERIAEIERKIEDGEIGGGGADGNTTYTIYSQIGGGVNAGTYLQNQQTSEKVKIINLANINTTDSENSITSGRNDSGAIGTGIKYSQVFGSGHTIGNNVQWSFVRGNDHTVNADVSMSDVSGYRNNITGSYHTIHGTEFVVSGSHNVTFGVGGGCAINGQANMVAGDLRGTTISGNYNTILCGGGSNTITGTAQDPCQHNVILGSTTTLVNSENCLTLGRSNTINNHNRSVLMGIGLTATRDNQLVVGAYNDSAKAGGAFVVANGKATGWTLDTNSTYFYADNEYRHDILDNPNTTYEYRLADGTSMGTVVYNGELSFTCTGYMSVDTSSNSIDYPCIEVHCDYLVDGEPVLGVAVYEYKTSNAMTVYSEGTVTIGHDPIGPMDVVTKQYLENALLTGKW